MALALPVGNRQSSIIGSRRALLRWFRRYARPLPWRDTKDPYRIWVSEIMLQQTQVATVIPYYRRFLRAFPTVRHLARAPLERVLELWSGLGYYARARHLHRAARKVVREFDGRLPADFNVLRSLPGIGGYTAGAILSIAYNLPVTALDSNVARVVARLAALRGNLQQPRFRNAVEKWLQLALSPRSPGEFNQALMELGQTVCLPRAPRCRACPLRRSCAAFLAGDPEAYPAPRPRRATESRYLAAAVLRRDTVAKNRAARVPAPEPLPGEPSERARIPNPVAMVRGLDDGLLSDLWNFPSAFGSSRAAALARLEAKLPALVRGPIAWAHGKKPVAQLRHCITFRAITVHVYAAGIVDSAPSLSWIPAAKLRRAALSQLARKILLAAEGPTSPKGRGLFSFDSWPSPSGRGRLVAGAFISRRAG